MSRNESQRDEQFEDLIARLQDSQLRAPALSATFKAQLRTQLQSRATQSRIRPRQRPAMIWLPLAITAIIITIIIAVWQSGQHAVSAADIVSRATRAAAEPRTFGLESYSGVRLNWIRDTHCDSCDVQSAPLILRGQERISFQAPDLMRREIYAYLAGVTSGNSAIATIVPDEAGAMMASAIIVNDGNTVWWYHIPEKYVEQHSPAITYVDPIPADFDALMDKLGQESDNVTLLGTETIAGRDAYVLSFMPKSDVAVWPFTVRIKSWIDKQTYIQLGQEYLDKHGETLYKWQYTKFEPNLQLAPDLFSFNPPNGIKVIDLRTPTSEAELAVDWRVIALSADYKVFRPVGLPAQLIMEQPQYGPPVGYSAGITQVLQNFYMKGQENAAFVLFENKNIGEYSFTDNLIRVGSDAGQYREESGRRILIFSHDGTLIFLQVNQQAMTKDELLHIAESMELVPAR